MTSSDERRRVTSSDVAAACGVSRATVSFVLNRTPGQTIPEHTRKLVEQAAARLGYTPNASAQILAGGRSRFVIIALRDLPLGDLVSAYEQVAVADLLRNDFIPVIAQAHGPVETRSLLTLAATLRPAAVMTTAPLDADEQAKLRECGNPRLLHPFASQEELLRPFAATGEAQAHHLLARGHSQVCFVGVSDPAFEHLVRARRQGVEDACTASSATFAGTVNWTGDTGEMAQSLDALLSRHPGTTAVAAYNDHVAIAVLAAARRLRLDVPSQLAVVGADNLSIGELVTPTLSSIASDVTTSPKLTHSELILSREEVRQRTDVGVRVVRREST